MLTTGFLRTRSCPLSLRWGEAELAAVSWWPSYLSLLSNMSWWALLCCHRHFVFHIDVKHLHLASACFTIKTLMPRCSTSPRWQESVREQWTFSAMARSSQGAGPKHSMNNGDDVSEKHFTMLNSRLAKSSACIYFHFQCTSNNFLSVEKQALEQMSVGFLWGKDNLEQVRRSLEQLRRRTVQSNDGPSSMGDRRSKIPRMWYPAVFWTSMWCI